MSAIHLFPRVFASLDGGSTQEIVARRAVAIAAANNADLLFGHVVDSVPFEANGADFDALCESRKEQLEADLADILEEARKNPDIKSVDLQVRAGRITDTLSEQLIEPFKPDLVICGERGLSNMQYAFVGSVSKYLIRTVRCDVHVVKA